MNTIFAKKENGIGNIQSVANALNETCYLVRVPYGRDKEEFHIRPESEILDRGSQYIVCKAIPYKKKKTEKKEYFPPIKTTVDLFRLSRRHAKN